MHSDQVKETANKMGLSNGGPTPMTGAASKREREQRRQDRKKKRQGKMGSANDFNDKAKSTTNY